MKVNKSRVTQSDLESLEIIYVKIDIYELTCYHQKMIKYILLGLLNYSPMTGYDLKQTIDSSTAHFWHAHHSQIYTTLRDIEKEGLVVSQIINEENRPERRVYTITGRGKETFKTWLAKPFKKPSPIKEEFLVRLFFSGQRDRQSVIRELEMQRGLHEDVLASYDILEKTIPEHALHKDMAIQEERQFWLFTLDMGIKFEKMYIDWINQVIQSLMT